MSEYKSKGSKIFVTIFIGLIVVSFMFTGYQTMQGTPDAIAKVGPYNISYSDFQRELQGQTQYYKNFFGGKDLTSAQIKQFKLKEAALQNLIRSKLALIFAEDMGIIPSTQQIKEEIKRLPYFLTNKVFDINKYKSLLAANQIRPEKFEKDITAQLKSQSSTNLLTNFPLSKSFVKEIEKFKSKKLGASIVQFRTEALRTEIPVSKKEISAFLSDKTNKQRVESFFNEKKQNLDRPEKVKASHILLKVTKSNEKEIKKKIDSIAKKLTRKNFATLANKHTEDPSGRGKGGALNWFEKGRMVPEFDSVAFSSKVGTISQPVKTSFGYHIIYIQDKQERLVAKIKEHEKSLATELIQKEKNTELDKMTADLSTKLSKLLNSNNVNSINKMKARYSLVVDHNIEINRYDGSKGKVMIDSEDIDSIFSGGAKFYTFKKPGSITLAKVKTFKAKKGDKKPTIDSEYDLLKKMTSRKFSEEIISTLQKDKKVTTNERLLNM